jgi:hypothetical protein
VWKFFTVHTTEVVHCTAAESGPGEAAALGRREERERCRPGRCNSAAPFPGTLFSTKFQCMQGIFVALTVGPSMSILLPAALAKSWIAVGLLCGEQSVHPKIPSQEHQTCPA